MSNKKIDSTFSDSDSKTKTIPAPEFNTFKKKIHKY